MLVLPICFHGHKIRNDQGYWDRLERFITERSDATFTHGICPEVHGREVPSARATCRGGANPAVGPAPARQGLAGEPRMVSIWSMVSFMSATAARNGAEVVMSTPARRSRSTGWSEPPAESMAR
jgi:hypothetical protein